MKKLVKCSVALLLLLNFSFSIATIYPIPPVDRPPIIFED